MKHARQGKPQCDACGKQFSSWPAFMSHFNQQACPVLHTQSIRSCAPTVPDSPLADGALAPEGTTESASGSYVPIFKQLQTKDIAKTGNVSRICKHIRDNGLIDRCPECGVSCKPMYISRHACKQHAWIREANAQVIQWVRNCQVPSKPCQWCGTQYSTSNKAHRNACPVLWMRGHLLSKYFTLKPSGQHRGQGKGEPQQAQRQQRPPEVLVGQGEGQELQVKRPGLGPSWSGQSARALGSSPGGLPFGDATGLPSTFRSGASPLKLYSVGCHWRDQKAKNPKALGQPLRTVLFRADGDQVSHRRDPDQARSQGSRNPYGPAGERLLPVPGLVSRRGKAQEGGTGADVRRGHPPSDQATASAHHPPQRDRQVPSSAQADSRYA